jgi:acyl-[acyl-carrier-protein]-phospholipid O-acyltransferase/long-chain-fatty-acid--[acyl-carrier-protein] ligase
MRFVIRFAVWTVAHTIFKVRIVGRENIPSHGAALLAANHVSYADGFLISYCVTAPIRFMVWTPFFRIPGINWVLRIIKAIPLGFGGRRETVEAIRRARDELEAGHIVCIFPEGSITRTGELFPFKRGMEKIVEGLDVPIVPVRLDGLWGSIFSFEGGKAFWKWPRRVPHPVTICFGDPMPASSTASDVREAILDLAAEAAAIPQTPVPQTPVMTR